MPINFGAALGAGLQSATATAAQANKQKLEKDNADLRNKLLKQEESRRQTIHEMSLNVAPQPKLPTINEGIALRKETRENDERIAETRLSAVPPLGPPHIPGVVSRDTHDERMAEQGEYARLYSESTHSGKMKMLTEALREDNQIRQDQEIAKLDEMRGLVIDSGVYDGPEGKEALARMDEAIASHGGSADLNAIYDSVVEDIDAHMGKERKARTREQATKELKDLVGRTAVGSEARTEVEARLSQVLDNPLMTEEEQEAAVGEAIIEADTRVQNVMTMKMAQAIEQAKSQWFQQNPPQMPPSQKVTFGKASAKVISDMDRGTAEELADAINAISNGEGSSKDKKAMIDEMFKSQGLPVRWNAVTAKALVKAVK